MNFKKWPFNIDSCSCTSNFIYADELQKSLRTVSLEMYYDFFYEMGISEPKDFVDKLTPENWQKVREGLTPPQLHRLSGDVVLVQFLKKVGLQDRSIQYLKKEIGIMDPIELVYLTQQDWEKIQENLTDSETKQLRSAQPGFSVLGAPVLLDSIPSRNVLDVASASLPVPPSQNVLDVASSSLPVPEKMSCSELMHASEEGQVKVVKHIIRVDKTLTSATDTSGESALHKAAWNGHIDVCAFLLEQGANVNLKDNGARTPLMAAARNGHKEVCACLLEKGADADLQDSNGQTALYWAAFRGHRELYAFLIKKGADPDIQDNDGQTPLMMQLKHSQDFLLKKFDDCKFELLLDKKKVVLVLGMGGGCDVFLAYAFAKKLNNDSVGTGNILYGNCISRRKDGIPDDHLTLIQNTLYAVPPGDPRPLVEGENPFGTTYIEQSVPRGAGNSPLLLELIGNKGVLTDDEVAELINNNIARIIETLTHLQVDLVFGIDSGGDSLLGIRDSSCNPLIDRDQQMIYAFRKYRGENPEFNFYHVVMAPGCEAKIPWKVLQEEVWHVPTIDDSSLKWCVGRNFLGAFSVEKLVLDCFPLVESLEQSRTPFLMYRALIDNDEYFLERPQDNIDQAEAGGGNLKDLVKISRNGNDELVPRSWLTTALLFEYDCDSDSVAL